MENVFTGDCTAGSSPRRRHWKSTPPLRKAPSGNVAHEPAPDRVREPLDQLLSTSLCSPAVDDATAWEVRQLP